MKNKFNLQGQSGDVPHWAGDTLWGWAGEFASVQEAIDKAKINLAGVKGNPEYAGYRYRVMEIQDPILRAEITLGEPEIKVTRSESVKDTLAAQMLADTTKDTSLYLRQRPFYGFGAPSFDDLIAPRPKRSPTFPVGARIARKDDGHSLVVSEIGVTLWGDETVRGFWQETPYTGKLSNWWPVKDFEIAPIPTFQVGDRVTQKGGAVGTVTAVSAGLVQVKLDTGEKPGRWWKASYYTPAPAPAPVWKPGDRVVLRVAVAPRNPGTVIEVRADKIRVQHDHPATGPSDLWSASDYDPAPPPAPFKFRVGDEVRAIYDGKAATVTEVTNTCVRVRWANGYEGVSLLLQSGFDLVERPLRVGDLAEDIYDPQARVRIIKIENGQARIVWLPGYHFQEGCLGGPWPLKDYRWIEG